MGEIEAVNGLRLSILVDNTVRAGARGLLGEHGFAVMLEAGGEGVLFDTGQSGTALVNNLKGMKVKPTCRVVLSHGHYDHSGGLLGYAKSLPAGCEVYAHPDAFKKRFKKVGSGLKEIGMPLGREELARAGAVVKEGEGPRKVSHWLSTSGVIARGSFERPETEFFIEEGGKLREDQFLDDTAVAAKVEGKGLVIVTGCAHAGVVNTALHLMRLTGEERVHAIIGGFHLVDASARKMAQTISALERIGPRYIVPCHCTGGDAEHALRNAFKGRVVPGEAGLTKAF